MMCVLHLLTLQFCSDIFKHLTGDAWQVLANGGAAARENEHSKRNQMSIETVSVEQTMGNTMKLKLTNDFQEKMIKNEYAL